MPRRSHQRGPTIRDVAREAGVGLGTVSRVLNGGKEVSRATRDRVLVTIQRLGFRPNAQARRIHRQHSEIVCFVLSNRDFLNPFHARILQGVEDCARLLRQHVLFAAATYESDTAAHRIVLPSLLAERGLFDGLILSGTNYSNFIRRIQHMQIPFVAFGNNLVDFEGPKRFDQVSYDGKQGEMDIVRHIVRQGHKSIAFVGGRTYPWARVRHDAYLQVLSEEGLKPITIAKPDSSSTVQYGEWASSRILAGKSRPTAVVAVNDEVAYGLWRAFRRRDVRVPADISLAGFDDREEATLMDPPLTTVRVRKMELGQACMRTLLERLHHPDMAFTERVLSTELIVRGTVRRV